MKSNIDRRKEIFKGVLPPHGSEEYDAVVKVLKQNEHKDPSVKEFTKKNWEKVTKSIEAQYLSNCGLITEKTLRHFLSEFNNRAWKYGLRSMPVMFNIMEAFFNYRKPEIYFELLEEENYLISFFDFIDFITSKDFLEKKILIEENIISDLIYNFNVGQDLNEIKFKSDNGNEFIIAGLSIIRRGSEITVLATTGKKKEHDISIDKESFRLSTDNPDKSRLVEEIKKDIEKNEFEYEYIDEEKNYIKVLVACRIDIETMTIDARYVAEETNLMFTVITDETDGFLDKNGDFITEELKDAYLNSKKKIEEFSAVFEVVKQSLYLPHFFNLNDEIIIEEELETDFKKQSSSPLKRRKFSNIFGAKYYSKPLYSLDKHDLLSPDKIKLRDDLFRIKSDGYWKKLEIDEIGLDKKGKPIHGRTWVNKNLSWFEAKEDELIVEKKTELFKGENSGFIYILRNPTMEQDIFKIGLTRKDVEERAKQLSKTSVPDKFYKAQEWNVKDCVEAEKIVHERLKKERVDPRREFFKVKYENAISVIKEVVDEINK